MQTHREPSLPGLVSSQATPVALAYPQFKTAAIPPSTNAIAAWEGYIQPFADDESALQILRSVEASQPMSVDAGTLISNQPLIAPHPADAYLIGMTIQFQVLALEFGYPEHPRAYLISPRVQEVLPSPHPHIRSDRSIVIDGRQYPALCVYSGAEFSFNPDEDRLVQFLDQTATYLARHLIWLKTRMLVSRDKSFKDQIVYRRKPSEPILSLADDAKRNLVWSGYWPGKSAASGAARHLETISPNQECWCWSGKLYRNCHQLIERKQMAHIS